MSLCCALRPRHLLLVLVGCWAAFGGLLPVRGELPMPRFDRLQPLGGISGSTVEVEVAGNDLEEAATLLFDHPGITAARVDGQERRFRVTIAGDVPWGTYDAWLVGRYGVSNSRLFAVLQGLQAVAEQEPNNSLEKAQSVPLNAVVHGASDQNDQDLYRFTAAKGQRLVVQCRAGKLDSALDPTLSLSTTTGMLLAANGDYWGRDSQLDFVAPQDGDYVVSVSDLSFRGGHPYQLIVSDAPQIENVFPRAVRAGQTTEVTFYGRQLGAGASASRLQVGDLPLDELRSAVTPPAEVLDRGQFLFREHPTDHTTLPTAATCTLLGWQVSSGLPRELGPAVPLFVTPHEVTVEQEPNDAPDRAQRVSLPLVVSGRFDAARDGDWYEFESGAAGNYYVDVYCERLGGRADPYVAVLDEQGNRVAELDDYGHRVNAFDGHLRDPSGQVNLAAQKKYRLLVQDRYRRGGARYQYVLAVRSPVPDFFVAAIHRQNPGPGGTTIGRGGATYVDLIVHGADGFNGPLTISADNPPPGVQVEPAVIHGNAGVVVLRAAEDAPDGQHWLQLVASGQQGEQTLRRDVRPYTRVSNDTNYNSSRPMRRWPVAIRDVAPFEVRFEPATVNVEAGQKATVTLRLRRRWAEARLPVTVQPLSFPGNFKLGNQEFKPEVSELPVTIEVQAGTRPGDYTLAVLCQSQVPFAKDATAANKPNTLVSLPSLPLRLTVTAPGK
ncbi:MAG: PPC domain-containing protein [Pirellulales bacterium]